MADNHIRNDRGNCLDFEAQNKFSLVLKLGDSYHHILSYGLVWIENWYFSTKMVLIKAYSRSLGHLNSMSLIIRPLFDLK